RRLTAIFPLIASALFLLIPFAEQLNLTHLPFPGSDYLIWDSRAVSSAFPLLKYLSVTLSILLLVVAFFVVLGGFVGRELQQHFPLRGYAINLAGSMAGILAFTLISYLRLPPAVWLSVGLCAALPFIKRPLVTIGFAAIILAGALNQRQVFWSPYYRID